MRRTILFLSLLLSLSASAQIRGLKTEYLDRPIGLDTPHPRLGWQMDGVYYLKVELASGNLNVGDDIMYVLIGADTRPHAVAALEQIVGLIKETCVKEIEITEA